MTLTKIALVGANGTLGPSLLSALLDAQTFQITVFTRHSSKSTYPPSIPISRLSNDPSTAELTTALKGQDALIIAFAGSNDTLQIRYADAAAAAGVKRFIPADFGSCDSSSPRALELVPLYQAKKRVREHLQSLASEGKLSWTSLVCGHFFDWGIETGFLQFDLKGRKARIFDGGKIRFSTSTLKRVAEATVRCLQLEEETRDRMLFVQSFCVSQNEILDSLRRVTETKATPGREWEVEYVESEVFIKELQKKLAVNLDDGEAKEELVSVVGIVDSNWEGREGFANKLLGLKNENLDRLVEEITKGHL